MSLFGVGGIFGVGGSMVSGSLNATSLSQEVAEQSTLQPLCVDPVVEGSNEEQPEALCT